jgi:hypothetical protein
VKVRYREETTVLADDIAKVRAHVEATVGMPDEWAKWPGGWPHDIESALIDAVFSARAVYRSEHGHGIYRNIAKWQEARTQTRTVFSLDALIAEIDAAGVATWADMFDNHQLSPGRPADAPCGPTKAATVKEAAGKLREAGINVAADIDSDTATTAKTTLRSVSGIGFATSNYFLMLLGVPGIKPDRMIHRFLKDATGHSFTNAYAAQVLRAVAPHFGVQEHKLDHAIWGYERDQVRRRRRTE